MKKYRQSRLAYPLTASVFCLCASLHLQADGGTGGSTNLTLPGGAGGTGYTGNPGQPGTNNMPNDGTGGGGGGAGGGNGGNGADGGLGGTGGTGGLGGTSISPNGQSGPAVPANPNPGTTAAGGGGGGGGYNGNGFGAASLNNTIILTGGNGGNGADGGFDSGATNPTGGGGGGGAGGYGAVVTGATTNTNQATITGGNGGAGGAGGGGSDFGSAGGNGGDGGFGIFFTTSGATLNNSGTITGGNGGAAGAQGGNPGLGGVGISGSDLTITNSGVIRGGLDGAGNQADAIDFTSGVNTLTLLPGSSITGNVVAFQGGSSLILSGSTNGTLAVSQDGSTAQYQGFTNYEKNGTGTWTLTSSTTAATPWTVSSGTLIVGGSGALGTGGVTINGGTLATGAGNHTIDVTQYTEQPAGNLSLSIAGAGTAATADQLAVTNANSLPSDVTLGGTLTVNLARFVASGPTGTTYTFNVVTTTAEYGNQFATFDPVGLLPGLTASLDYLSDPDDVTVDISGTAVLPTTALTPNQQGIVTTINNVLAVGTTSPAFANLVAGLAPYIASPSSFGAALDELSSAKFNAFASTTAFNNAAFDTQAQDDYLAGRRGGPQGAFIGGSGQLDTTQLVVNQPGVDPTLALIHSRLLAWNQPAGISDVASPLLGGVDMKDSKAMQQCNCYSEGNPWNVFVRGNVTLAQDFSQGDIPHVDDNTESVVAGADYRLTPNFLVGLTAGYAHTDATLDTLGSSATVDSYSPGIYAAWSDHGWYANFQGRYTYNSYTSSRRIDFLDQTADGATDGNEDVVDADGGYEFHHGAWTYGPLAGLQYTHLTLNSYNETGSDAALSVNEDQADSLRSRLGFSLNYAIHTPCAQLTPHLTASWQHEFMDQARGITSQFDTFGGGSFVVRTPTTDQDSALIDLGVDAQVNKSVSVFTDYSVQAGQSNYFGQSVQAGVKIGF